MLEWAQYQNGNKVLAQDLEDGYPKFPRCKKFALNYEAFEERDIADSAVELNSTKMTEKLLFACICTLLEDAYLHLSRRRIKLVQQIWFESWPYKQRWRKESNQTLQLYL